MAEIKNLHELPRFRDGTSYLYLEHSIIERSSASLSVFKEEGRLDVAVAALSVLMLGPGTRITHAAMKILAECGTTVLWLGEEGCRFYASGTGETRSARRLYRQARAWARPSEHLEVVKRLYMIRFDDPIQGEKSVEELRGMEGLRVKQAYWKASKETGVEWKGRNYTPGNWETADPINRALSAGAAFLYGISHAAIVSAGYSPALGFIHTGKQLSFVYDIADLYKTDILIPNAFNTVALDSTNIERRIRHNLRKIVRDTGLLKRIVDDINRLFVGLGFKSDDEEKEETNWNQEGSTPGNLWGPDYEAKGGQNYGDSIDGSDDS